MIQNLILIGLLTWGNFEESFVQVNFRLIRYYLKDGPIKTTAILHYLKNEKKLAKKQLRDLGEKDLMI